ncbi:MAG TPA: hypothetical protein VN861_03165 [Candidatus Acidoferrales bacterium]|nr:hypothetical protein [Candidatus Acidoferrales bacterium]
MPALLKPIDSNCLYVYCAACEANGNPNVMLMRELDKVSCPLGHIYSGQQLMSVAGHSEQGATVAPTSNLNMVKLVDFQPDSPLDTDIKWNIFVHPQVRSLLEQKFKGRLWVTISTHLAALADNAIVILSGADAAKLRKRGLTTSPQIVAALDASAELEKEVARLQAQVEQYANIFRQAGVTQ